MSRDFASFMASISGESAENRIKELMEILDKIMEITINSIDSITTNMQQLEMRVQNMTQRIVQLETAPRATSGQTGPASSQLEGVPQPVPPPVAQAPPGPRLTSPVSARSALQGELKALFAKRKRG
ncbi:MAG TPA: hypothetical protein VMV49_12645 [Candidatus Deferrimicrobium sp.]|nr:hypothetical protein [Candidatus Deferrimicrobium sp.]